MEVSDKNLSAQLISEVPGLEGDLLLETVVSLTGLPGQMVDQELRGILAAQEQDAANLTLEGLRTVMLAYLESIQSEMNEQIGTDQVHHQLTEQVATEESSSH